MTHLMVLTSAQYTAPTALENLEIPQKIGKTEPHLSFHEAVDNFNNHITILKKHLYTKCFQAIAYISLNERWTESK